MEYRFPQSLLTDPFNIGWAATFRAGLPPTLSISQRHMLSSPIEAHRSKCALLSDLLNSYGIVMQETLPEVIGGYVIIQVPNVPSTYKYGLVPMAVMKKIKQVIEAHHETPIEHRLPRQTTTPFGSYPRIKGQPICVSRIPWKREGF